MSIGKVNPNGTLNDGAFYSIPDVDVLMEESNKKQEDVAESVEQLDSKVTEIESSIDEISEALPPTPTAEDVGKALVVGEGGSLEYGENPLFIVNSIGGFQYYTSNVNGLDKTYEEIVNAINNGYVPIIKETGDAFINYYLISNYESGTATKAIYFNRFIPESQTPGSLSGIRSFQIRVTADDVYVTTASKTFS